MAFTPGFKARILNGDFSLSAKLSDVASNTAVELLDQTTFADNGYKRVLPGIDTGSFSASGFLDAATNTDSVAWTTAQPFTHGFKGLALGDPVIMINAVKSTFELGSSVGGVTSFSLDGESDGEVIYGVSLHDLTAETGSSSSTGYDQTTVSTTNGAVSHLQVTAFSGFSQVIYTIEDSANNTDWAVIGTHATITAAGSERLQIAGTVRRYVRVTWVKTGTGSATFSCAFARRP
jgi:hypothetical protein